MLSSSATTESENAVIAARRAAMAARQQNLCDSYQERLPAKLWCRIWEILPFVSRLAISHTCSRWRSIALDCPAMWTHLSLYTTVHESDCECMGCGTGDEELPPGWEISPYRENSDNLRTLRPLLGRCRNAPLHIDFDIVSYRPDVDALEDVAVALVKHGRQIHHISIRFCDYVAVCHFIQGIGECLQELRSATFEVVPDFKGQSHFDTILTRTVPFAQLECVRLSGTFRWVGAPLTFPGVRSLAFQPSESLGRELCDVLSSCSNLRTLSINLALLRRLRGRRSDRRLPDVVRLASSLHTVHVGRLQAEYESFILSAFRLPSRLELTLEYDVISQVRQSPAIFQDLGTYIHLRVSLSIDILSLEGTDEHGRIRRISGGIKNLADLQHFVSSQDPLLWLKVINLSADYSLWYLITQLLPETPGLMAVELTIDDLTALVPHPDECRHVPVLTLLSRGDVLTLLPGQISELVRRLCVCLPLTQLRIDHRLVAGSAASYSRPEIAHVVQVGVYHV